MKIDEGKVLLLLSGILSGIVISSFLISTNFSPTIFLSYKDYVGKRAEQNNLKNEISNLDKTLAAINEKLKKYENDEGNNKVIFEELKKELKSLQLEYGSTEVTGPGVVVTLRDRKAYLNDFEKYTQENLIHNYDIQNVVQDLINAGAEAIAINGYKFTTNMAITCVGPIMGLRVGLYDQIISPDFVIEAIGDPDILYNYLNQPESWYRFQLVDWRMMPVTIQKKEKITIKPVKINELPSFAGKYTE